MWHYSLIQRIYLQKYSWCQSTIEVTMRLLEDSGKNADEMGRGGGEKAGLHP